MSPLIERLQGCCEAVSSGDPALLAELREQGFDCEAQRWDFDLPALHAWLSERQAGETPGYADFLKQLYASDLNARLAALGAQVVIADNQGKLNASLYRLQRLP